MKKALLLILSTLMIAMAFSGCAQIKELIGIDSEITDPDTPETFQYQSMSLTLPGDFAADGEGIFSNGTYRVRAYQTLKSSITPNPGYAFPTLQQYFNIMLDEKATFRTEDGILCTDFDPTDNSYAIYAKQQGKQFMTFHETDTGFWIISFYADPDTVKYEDIQPTALEWLKTLSFEANTDAK